MIARDRRGAMDAPRYTLRQLADALIVGILVAAAFVAAMAVPA